MRRMKHFQTQKITCIALPSAKFWPSVSWLLDQLKKIGNGERLSQKPSKNGRWIIKPFSREFPKLPKLQTNRRRSYQYIVRKHTASTFLIDLPCIIVSASGKPLVVQGLILLPKATRIPPPRRMMNLLLSILPLDLREAHAASEASEVSGVSGVSGVVPRPAQVLPRVEARGVHFVRNYAYKDWLEEDRLTVGAQMCRTIARKGIGAIGISSMLRGFGCS